MISEGRQSDLLFDDIGDMIAYEREHKTLDVRKRFVHDHQTRQWLDADIAMFVQNERIHTPMGSGIVAFAGNSPDRSPTTQITGNVMNLTALMTVSTSDRRCCNED